MKAKDIYRRQETFRGPFAGGNVVDLSFYRRFGKISRHLGPPQQKNNDINVAESAKEYAHCMKVNAAAFVVLVALVYEGIWLISNISDVSHHAA